MKWDFNISTDEFKTLREYAKRFNVDAQTANSWSTNGGLPFVQPGSTKYTTDEAVNRWLVWRREQLDKQETIA